MHDRASVVSDIVLQERLNAQLPTLDPQRKMLLITGQLRENFDIDFFNVCKALCLSIEHSEIDIEYLLNLNLHGPVHVLQFSLENVYLIAPQDYLNFVRMMQRAYIVLTDSSEAQEASTYLSKIVLMKRQVTESLEVVAKGTIKSWKVRKVIASCRLLTNCMTT